MIKIELVKVQSLLENGFEQPVHVYHVFVGYDFRIHVLVETGCISRAYLTSSLASEAYLNPDPDPQLVLCAS